MDFTDSHYLKISRIHLKLLGYWPNQDPAESRIRFFISSTTAILMVFTQVSKFVRSFRELDMFAAIPPTISSTVCFFKLYGLASSKKKLQFIQQQINDDWRQMTDEDEINIMEKYASEGKAYTTVYMCLMYSIVLIYSMFIFESYVLDIVSPLNETRPPKLLYPAEFFVDEEKYFVPITVVVVLNCFFVIMILVTFDSMLISYVQYTCGMLAIVGYRLEHKLYECVAVNEVSTKRQRKKYHAFIVDSVHKHRKALHFINLLDSTYNLSQLLQLGLNITCLSVTLMRIVMLLGSFEVCRYLFYAIGQLVHLFSISYQSEKLIDHTLGISRKIYNGKWYTIPKEMQRMLLFMFRRSSIPAYLTAGKIFIYSMENFSLVVQNSVSYFMVLASFQ